MLLRRGESKCLANERVTYVPGPANEIRIVRKIYSLFLDSGLNCHAIARWLNQRAVPRDVGYKWNGQMVHKILSHAKYTGCIVFNQKSGRLRSKMKPNPREQWVIQPNSFPAIISQKRFALAQKRLNQRVSLRTNEQLLRELQEFVEKHGKATQVMLAADPSMATGCTYAARFGSFCRALELIKTEPPSGYCELDRRARMKIWLQDEFARTMIANNLRTHRKHGVFVSSAHRPVLLDVARCFVLEDGQLRWEIRYPLTGVEGLRCITLRLQAGNKLPMDYVFIPCLPRAIQRCRFSERRIQEVGFIRRSLDEAIELLLQDGNSSIPGRP